MNEASKEFAVRFAGRLSMVVDFLDKIIRDGDDVVDLFPNSPFRCSGLTHLMLAQDELRHAIECMPDWVHKT